MVYKRDTYVVYCVTKLVSPTSNKLLRNVNCFVWELKPDQIKKGKTLWNHMEPTESTCWRRIFGRIIDYFSSLVWYWFIITVLCISISDDIPRFWLAVVSVSLKKETLNFDNLSLIGEKKCFESRNYNTTTCVIRLEIFMRCH